MVVVVVQIDGRTVVVEERRQRRSGDGERIATVRKGDVGLGDELPFSGRVLAVGGRALGDERDAV